MRGKAMLGNAVLFVTMCILSFAILGEASRVEDASDPEGAAEVHGEGSKYHIPPHSEASKVEDAPDPEGAAEVHSEGSTYHIPAFSKGTAGSKGTAPGRMKKRVAALLMLLSAVPYGYFSQSMLSHGPSAQMPIHSGIRRLQQDGNTALAPPDALDNSVGLWHPPHALGEKGWFPEAIEAVTYGKAYEATQAAKAERLAQKERPGWSLEAATKKYGELSESTMPAFKADLLAKLDSDQLGLEREYEATKAAIRYDGTPNLINAVALAPAKVLKRFFKKANAAREYHRDSQWLNKETSRNLYRVQALLQKKTEKQIDQEWKRMESRLRMN